MKTVTREDKSNLAIAIKEKIPMKIICEPQDIRQIIEAEKYYGRTDISNSINKLHSTEYGCLFINSIDSDCSVTYGYLDNSKDYEYFNKSNEKWFILEFDSFETECNIIK